MSRLEDCIFKFSKSYKGPFLLGLSGGPDSTALFNLLLKFEIPFEVAHVDHGWREESRGEARFLKNLCEEKNISFHLSSLDPKQIKGNLEDGSRNHRLQFFAQICEKKRLMGVILGHHANDQAEIVLKRIFEGASLPKLRGMEMRSKFASLTLFRPMLAIPKNEILDWLKKREVTFFEDNTNEDSRFLRGRCRTELIPTLSKAFGKEIATSLCRLSESSRELNEFLQESLQSYRCKYEENEEAFALDLGKSLPNSRFILKSIVRDLFEKKNLTLSASVLETIIQHIQAQKANIRIQVGRHQVVIHRGKISILNQLTQNEQDMKSSCC